MAQVVVVLLWLLALGCSALAAVITTLLMLAGGDTLLAGRLTAGFVLLVAGTSACIWSWEWPE